MTVTLLDTAEADPIKAFRARIQVTEQFAKVFFKKRTWNDIVRAGLVAGGEKWRAGYLPLRFTNYAVGVLQYRGKSKIPLVHSGRLRADAITNSWVDASVTSSNATLNLHISTPSMLDPRGQSTGVGYSGNPIVYNVLAAITSREIAVIAAEAERVMIGLIEGANVSVTRKGTVNGTLTKTQRSSIAHTKKPQGVSTTRRAS